MTKHFFKSIAALVMCLPLCLTSCSKDDDNSTTPNNNVDIVSINTAAFYDKLGTTDFMAESLVQGTLKVTDSVLVYDQQGLLVARLGAESTSLQPVNISLKDLPNGTYTLVAWQTATTGSEPFWMLMDADQLATVRIVQLYPSTISSKMAIGMFSTTVTVGSGSGTLNAEIESMGSIVDIRIDGLTSECDYKSARLVVGGENPAIDGFYLNPDRSGEDRWVFSDERTEDSRPIGGVTPSSPINKVFTLSHGEKVFNLYGTDKTTNEKDSIIDAVFTLKPGTINTFYFNLDKPGYQPPYCGPMADFAAWKADRDAGILVTAPCLQWGANLQAVHNHVVSHHQWWKLDYEELTMEEGHGWCRWYNIAKNFFEYYCFDTESGNNLMVAMCICFDPTVPVNVANASLILQGYEYAGKIIYPDQPENIYDIFFSADGNIEVTTNTYEEGGWQIFYQPTDPEDLPLIIPVN